MVVVIKCLYCWTLQTGMRLSELTQLRWKDVHLGPSARVECMGKGRKERLIPLTRSIVGALRQWLRESNSMQIDWIFPTFDGGQMSADNFQRLLKKYVTLAQQKAPSLKHKRVTPHVLRHTFAMRLFEAGVDLSIIALLLGHESVDTVQIYVEVSMRMKEKILEQIAPIKVKSKRFKPSDKLFEFLKTL